MTGVPGVDKGGIPAFPACGHGIRRWRMAYLQTLRRAVLDFDCNYNFWNMNS